MKKILLRGYSNGQGYVMYVSKFRNDLTISDVNSICSEIKKDFPSVTENHIEITIDKSEVKLKFFTFDLPQKEKAQGLFDEERWLDY